MTKKSEARKTELPAALAAPYGDWSSAPQSREEAQQWVAMLNEKFDLIDQNEVLRDLIDKMEERHGETFNSFFDAVIRTVMHSQGLDELNLHVNGLLSTAGADLPPMTIDASRPGIMTYRLGDRRDDVDVKAGGFVEDQDGNSLGAIKNG